MSKEMMTMGSETRPPVLLQGEYSQWKKRMENFLDLIDPLLMKSIREGPIVVTVEIDSQPRTDTRPFVPAFTVEKPYDMYDAVQKSRAAIDKRALTLLIMALPPDMYCRVDSLTNARDIWNEIEQQ